MNEVCLSTVFPVSARYFTTNTCSLHKEQQLFKFKGIKFYQLSKLYLRIYLLILQLSHLLIYIAPFK